MREWLTRLGRGVRPGWTTRAARAPPSPEGRRTQLQRAIDQRSRQARARRAHWPGARVRDATRAFQLWARRARAETASRDARPRELRVPCRICTSPPPTAWTTRGRTRRSQGVRDAAGLHGDGCVACPAGNIHAQLGELARGNWHRHPFRSLAPSARQDPARPEGVGSFTVPRAPGPRLAVIAAAMRAEGASERQARVGPPGTPLLPRCQVGQPASRGRECQRRVQAAETERGRQDGPEWARPPANRSGPACSRAAGSGSWRLTVPGAQPLSMAKAQMAASMAPEAPSGCP